MAQQPPPRRVADCHAPEMTAIHTRQTVMLGEPLVEECVIRAQELQESLILPHLALEEQLRLRLHRLAQIVVELREDVRIRLVGLNVAHGQPLSDEVIHPPPRLPVGQHTPHLLRERVGVVQSAPCRNVKQLVVRNALPQEEGET